MTDQHYFEEIDQLMQAAWRLPDSVERMELVERAVAIADRAGDLDLQYELQLGLVQVAFNCGQLEKTIVAVAWCFGMHDRDPDRFGSESLLSVCTYAINSLSSIPTTSRAQIAHLLDNIEERYLTAGYSLRAIYRARCFNALWMGDLDEADRTFEKMRGCDIDFTYEGETWDQLFQIDYWIQRGELRRALQMAKPYLEEADTSQGAYCWLASFILLPLVRLGESEMASEAQRRSEADITQNPSFAECVGHHVIYLVATNRISDAVSLVDRCLDWAFESPQLRESLELAVGGWACVRRLRASGESRWPGNLSADSEAALGSDRLEQMESALSEFVSKSALRFDRRNENRHYRDLVDYRLAVGDPSWTPSPPEH